MLELLVTLAVLSLIASIAALGLRRIDRGAAANPARTIGDSLSAAIDSSRTTTVALPDSAPPQLVTVNADGSVVADSSLHVDRLTGKVARAK